MLSSVVSNAIGFTSYETGLRWYRDAHPGRSPTPMERACIAGTAAATTLLGRWGQRELYSTVMGGGGGFWAALHSQSLAFKLRKPLRRHCATSPFVAGSADAQLGASGLSGCCCMLSYLLQHASSTAERGHACMTHKFCLLSGLLGVDDRRSNPKSLFSGTFLSHSMQLLSCPLDAWQVLGLSQS